MYTLKVVRIGFADSMTQGEGWFQGYWRKHLEAQSYYLLPMRESEYECLDKHGLRSLLGIQMEIWVLLGM